MVYTDKHIKKCIDHYKCTYFEDHQNGLHNHMYAPYWWCELCITSLEIHVKDKVVVKENLFNFKRWFNGIKKFGSVKLNPPPQK